ncbi:MAG: DUF4286 family protein [Legionella sp.]|nr:DUF4286 family protein [Legionella sp.]
MLKYEVNLEINADIVGDYLAWLKPHIKKILGLEGFVKAELLIDRLDDTAGVKKITVAYYLKDFKSYEEYIRCHATAMRDEGLARFQGLFSAQRRVLEIDTTFNAL